MEELRGKVKEYFETHKISKYGNASLLVKSGFMFSLYLIPYALMLTGVIHTLPLIILSWIVMGLGMAGIGMVMMHDANHGTFSAHARVNRWLGKSLYLLGGFPPTWRYQHNTLHHGFTNIEGHDEDISPPGVLRFSPHKPLYKIHRYQHIYAWFFYGMMTLSWITTKDFLQIINYRKAGTSFTGNSSFGRMLINLLTGKILYYTLFLILPLLFIPVAWYWVLLSLLAMHFVSGLILGTVFQTAHVVPSSAFPLPDDRGTMENSWAVHQVLTTSDFAPGSRILSWLIGGLNYQVEHHLFPNISHVHYRRIAHLVKETAAKYGLPYHVQPDFLTAVRNHALMLKKLGQNVQYF